MSHHHRRHPPRVLGGKPPSKKFAFKPHPHPVLLAIKLGIVFFCIFYFGQHVHPGGNY